jgi:hypothetical protein
MGKQMTRQTCDRSNSSGMLMTSGSGRFRESCYGCYNGEGLLTDPEPPSSYMTCLCRTGNGNDEELTSLNLSKSHNACTVTVRC